MDQGKIWRDFIALPPEAQQEVAGFITFLQTSYEQLRSGVISNEIDLADDPFIGVWRDREDIQGIHY